MRNLGLTARIFLPFAAGYYLSYVFRTINAVIAGPLAADISLDASHLGLLTSVYFLAFAVVQLPVGAALDHYGPRRVQGVLLVLAAAGAALFAAATSLPGLLLGRTLIGLGVSGGLMAGLKAIVLWLPKERLALANGAFVALGTAGAVTATEPAELFLASTDWRHLFTLLAALTAATAIAIVLLVPNTAAVTSSHRGAGGLRTAYGDSRFWRMAPLSTSCIGTAWALQGLWAAPWLADVAALQHEAVVHHLFVMAVALCAGALLVGLAADRLRRFGVTPRALLGLFATCFIAAELALVFRVPIATSVPWAVIAAMGGATVLSYAILADLFGTELAGRANAALNLFHVGGAFALQSMIGFVVEAWPRDAGGHYPAPAYAAAFGSMIVLQAASLVWFLLPEARTIRQLRLLGPDHDRALREAADDRRRARGRLL
ncbi:MAG: MFS transporter [Stellaceae bacterium]